MSTARTNKARLEAAHKRRRAVEMRRYGCSYTEIASALGCARSTAFGYVSKEIEKLSREAAEDAKLYCVLECERLDALQVSIWGRAMNGDLKAIQTVLRIMERRAKLLGLDAPTKVASTTPDGEEAAPPGVLILPDTAPGIEEWLEQYRNPYPAGETVEAETDE